MESSSSPPSSAIAAFCLLIVIVYEWLVIRTIKIMILSESQSLLWAEVAFIDLCYSVEAHLFTQTSLGARDVRGF
jgi:hypothetical protein